MEPITILCLAAAVLALPGLWVVLSLANKVREGYRLIFVHTDHMDTVTTTINQTVAQERAQAEAEASAAAPDQPELEAEEATGLSLTTLLASLVMAGAVGGGVVAGVLYVFSIQVTSGS